MDIDTHLLFRPLNSDTSKQAETVRQLTKTFAETLGELLADGAQRDQVILKVREICLLSLDCLANNGALTMDEAMADHMTSILLSVRSKHNEFYADRVIINAVDFADWRRCSREVIDIETQPELLKTGLMCRLVSYRLPYQPQLWVSKDVKVGTYLLEGKKLDPETETFIPGYVTVESLSPMALRRKEAAESFKGVLESIL